MIRDAGARDASGIRSLMESVSGLWDETWRTNVLDRVLRSSETVALVCVEGERVIGFACGHDVGFRAYLSELVVLPAAQGRGVGARLLSELEHRMAGRGCVTFIADVWREARSFYESHGWAPPPVVLLRKRLHAKETEGT
jgi:GNAT superfamily N-acetyltransferase